jgi:hypothetical protein
LHCRSWAYFAHPLCGVVGQRVLCPRLT